ncbi:unnamed protein product [Peronospora belbahrii]|uniref:WW domain-containing protein n=1 Tax=Peronospora belbahrii TaxID=622444 RepID=A0AAU9KKM6_9STRA|nr:unnamed protein product [Peronospora belbahrii]
MAPESGHRARRHRSQPRGQSRPHSNEVESPQSREFPRRQGQVNDSIQSISSPTREKKRVEASREPRERRKQEVRLRSKSRPPESAARMNGEGTRGRGSSIKRPRVRFSTIELECGAETLTMKGTCSGLLRKQADNEPGAWNQYYFVIKPLTYLFYYNSKDDETPRGIIDLEYLTDVKLNADCLQRAVGGGDHCFRVSGKLPRLNPEQVPSGDVPKMRPVYLDTEDEEEAKKWINAIRNHRFSVKKAEQFLDMTQQLRDTKLQVSELMETQQRETEMKRALRIKAKTLLQKMRAVDSGKTDELPQVDIDLDDTADDMLAMLEGMEDVLVNLQMKLDQQKQEITQMKADKTGTAGPRRGFTQVLQRAVSRRENTSVLEMPEDDEEEALAAIRNRRQRKPVDQAIPKEKPKEKPQEKPREKPQEKPQEKLSEKLQEKPWEKPKEKINEKLVEEPPASMDNVSDVLAMWKAKKKKSPSSTKQSTLEDVSDDGSGKNSKLRSARGGMAAPESGSARKQTAVQKIKGSERLSEEDTASLNSTEDHESEEKLPPGWTKHESRGYPGTYYYANEDGKVSWDVPTDDMAGSELDKKDNRDDRYSDHDEDYDDHDDRSNLDDDVYNEYDHRIDHNVSHDQENEVDVSYVPDVDTSIDYLSENETDEETAGGTTSAAYRKQKPKPKSAWAFKLPKLLPTATAAAPMVAPEVAASLSPIRHGANHHEF